MQKEWFLALPDWVKRSEDVIIWYFLNASQNKKLLAMQGGKLFRTNLDASNTEIAKALLDTEVGTENGLPPDQPPADEPDQTASDAPVLPPEAASPVDTTPSPVLPTPPNSNTPSTPSGTVPPVGVSPVSPAAPSIPPTPAPSAPPSGGAKASPSLTPSGQEALTRARREYVRAETMYTKLAQEAVATRPKGLGIVSAFKKLLGKEDWARASDELNKIERYANKYQEARATYVATDVSLFLQEQKALELYKWQHEQDSKTGLEKMVGGVREFLSGGYKVLGDINVANAWTGSGRKLPDSAVGQFFLRTASLRTGISLALLGAGVGALAAGAWAPAALAIGTRRVLGGIGTSYGLYEVQRNTVLKNMKEALGVGSNGLSPDSMPLLSLRDELTKIAGLTAYEGVDIKKSQYAAYYDTLQKELDKRFKALQDDPAPQPGTTPIRPSQTKEQKQKVFMELFFNADAQDLTQAQRQHLQSIDSTAKNIAIGAAGAFVGTGAAGYVLGELAGKPFTGEQLANTTNTPQSVAPRMPVQDIPSKNTGIPPSNEGTIKKFVPNKTPQLPRGVPPPNLTPRSDILPPFEQAPSAEQPLPKNQIVGESRDRLVWAWESDTKSPLEFQGIPELKSEHMKSLIEYGPYSEEQKQALVNYAEQLDQLEPILGSPKALANTLKDASFIDNTAGFSQFIQSDAIEQDPLIQARITQEVENFRNAKELFKKNIGSQSFRELEKMLVEQGNLKDQFPVPYQSGVQLNYHDNPVHQGVFEQQKQLFLEKRFKGVLKDSLLKKLNDGGGI